MQVQIDKDRSVVLMLPPRPVIHANVLDGFRLWSGSLLQTPQHCIVACGDRQTGEKSLPRKTAGHVADDADNLGCSSCLARIRACHLGKALAEDPARAVTIPATESTDCRADPDCHSLPGQVLKTAAVAAMDGVGDASTKRTLGILFDTNDQPEAALVSFDTVQDEDAGIGKK